MNFAQSISIPESELLQAKETVLRSINQEVWLLLMKSESWKNGVHVPITRIIKLDDVVSIPWGGWVDFSPTTERTIHSIKARTGLWLAWMWHSHLLRHWNYLSDADKRVIELQRSRWWNQMNMLFKIAEKSWNYTVFVTAFNNLCESIPIDILDEQSNVITCIWWKTQTSWWTRPVQYTQQTPFRREDFMPPGGFWVPPKKSFWQKIFWRK
jgi:hypothetical protein